MLVGLAGALITVSAVPFSSVTLTRGRTLVALALLVIHGAACVAYYLYVQHNPADAASYYYDTWHLMQLHFSSGTVFTTQFTQFLKKVLGGSYIECFIFFQSIGFWGIMILMRTFQEISLKLRTPERILPVYLLFLPSLHFWTSAIGKDAPLFFAISLCVWSALEWRKRLMPFAGALVVMVLFRAHIALIAVMAVAAAAALHPRISFGRKALLLAFTAGAGLFLAVKVQAALNVDVTSASSLASFLQDRNDIAAKIGGGSTFGNAPLPLRFVNLLFRPFFFDAKNLMGVVASIENIGSLWLFTYLLINWSRLKILLQRVFFIEYAAALSVILLLLLGLVNYNLGLGLRERVMAFPPLLCLFVALYTMPRKRTKEAMNSSRGIIATATRNSRAPEAMR